MGLVVWEGFEIAGGGSDGEELDAVDVHGLAAKPGGVVAFAGPDDRGHGVVIACGEGIVGGEPVGLGAGEFLGEEPGADVGHLGIVGSLSPDFEPVPGVEGFGGGFLVVAVTETGVPIGP